MSKIYINHDLLANIGSEEIPTDAHPAEPAVSANDFELIDFESIYEADRYGLRFGLNKSDKPINK